MAARFAVSTGNWSGAIWAATSGGAAGSAAVPTAADDATINKSVVVTIDDTTAVCLSLTLSVGTTGADVGGKIQPSQVANSKITIQNGVTSSGASGGSGAYSSYFAFDMSAVPQYTAEIVLNNANAAASTTTGANLAGNVTLVGAVRKRHTVLSGAISAGATSCTVADATGWRVGDKLIFATTSAYNSTPRTDEVTIGTVDTGTGAVTWVGGTTYDHAANCPVGNFSSNLIIRPGTTGGSAFVLVTSSTANTSADIYVTDVEFRSQAAGTAQGANPFGINAANTKIKSASNNAFYDFRSSAFYVRAMASVFARSNNIFYTTTASIISCTTGQDVSGTAVIGPDEDYVVFRCVLGLGPIFPEQHQRRHKISGITQSSSPATGAIAVTKPEIAVEDCAIWSSNSGISNVATVLADSCTFGSEVFAGCDNTVSLQTGAGSIELTDCVFPASVGISGMSASLPGSQVRVLNRDADPAIQEIYGSHSNTVPIIQRDATTINRSTSSVLMTCNASTAIEHSFEVLAKAGETIRVIGFVMKSGTPAYGASTLPKITISGLGITSVVATMAGGTAADTWEQLTLDATNSGSSDGLLTVTFTAQSATAGAKAWFSGIPVAPFVSRCRHYGYTFDETNPVRATNITVSASEAIAASYTGMTVTWGASSSSVAVTTSNTLQKLYDYTQAQGCLNVGSAMPLTGAGVAGSPALFAAGNVTVSDGAVLNGSGSLSMGGFTILATEFPSGLNYSYSGGTWGQLSNSPTFAGGTLNIGAAATYTFATTGAIIINMTPIAPSTYAMASVTATGQVDLRNTTAHAITVELSSAAAALAITTNNTGGTITISAPQVYQQVPITNITTTSRLQIYDESAIAPVGSRELYNGVPGATSYTWTDPLPAVATRDIRVRIADVTGVTAKEFVESSIGTCGITEGTKSVSYRASQVADTTYNTNAVNGSLVTGITFTDAATDLVNVNLAGGNTTWQNIYAAFVYWISTAVGITDDIAYVDGVDPANYLLTSMKVKNLNAAPLTITGGFARDATTGSIVDIIDTAGGFIFPLVDHVVSKVVTVGGVNVITGDIADIPVAPTTTEIWSDSKALTVAKFLGLKD